MNTLMVKTALGSMVKTALGSMVKTAPGSMVKTALGICLSTWLTACSDGIDPGPSPAEMSPEQLQLQMGKRQSRQCAGCHGPKGISRVDSYPSLAGRSEDYLQRQLKAFRSGERRNPMMSSIATNLSDEAIVALSRYYASLPGPERSHD